MEDKKISELDPGISRPSKTDFVPILDSSETETKKIQFKNFVETDLQKKHAYPFTTDFQSNIKQTRNLSTITTSDGYIFNSNLQHIYFGSNVTSIGDFAFVSSSLTGELRIPNSVVNVGNGAFYGCTGITSVKLGKSVGIIKAQTFGACSGLTGINIDELNNLRTIDSDAFALCTSLTSITIPDTVTSVEHSAFFFCTGLTGINCNAIKNVFEPNGLVTTPSGLTINARASDTTWTAGSGLSIGGNQNVTVIKNL